MTKPRTGQFTGLLDRNEFHLHFQASFSHPSFGKVKDALAAVEEVAWDNYSNERKTARTEKAGPGFADPGYDLSVEWREARDRLIAAEARQKDPDTRSRVLLICGADRNDGTCPGEMSKTFRLTQVAREVID